MFYFHGKNEKKTSDYRPFNACLIHVFKFYHVLYIFVYFRSMLSVRRATSTCRTTGASCRKTSTCWRNTSGSTSACTASGARPTPARPPRSPTDTLAWVTVTHDHLLTHWLGDSHTRSPTDTLAGSHTQSPTDTLAWANTVTHILV